jgi:hypothetical protein
MSEWTTKAKRKVELGIFCAESLRASCSIGRRAGDHDDGIKGLLFKQLYSFLNHFDLQCSKRFNTGSFKLDLGPRSFSNHKLVFKFWTLYQIKMTQKWINMVDTGSNKVQTISF